MASENVLPPLWRAKLDRVLEARKAGAVWNHLRVSLLVEIFEDVEYRDKLRYELGETVIDDEVIAATLDQYVSDLGLPLIQLRAVLAEFPNPGDWETEPLWKLFDTAMDRRREAEPRESHKPRRTATIAQVESLESKLAEAQATAKQLPALRGQVRELTEELNSLRQRVADLERENAELRHILAGAQTMSV